EMSVARHDVQTMPPRMPRFELCKRLPLTLGQEASVLFTSEESEASTGLGPLGRKIVGQLSLLVVAHQVAAGHAPGHLFEERQRNRRELLLDPLVRRRVQVFVRPKRREA